MDNFYIRYKTLQYKFIGVNRSIKIEKVRKITNKINIVREYIGLYFRHSIHWLSRERDHVTEFKNTKGKMSRKFIKQMLESNKWIVLNLKKQEKSSSDKCHSKNTSMKWHDLWSSGLSTDRRGGKKSSIYRDVPKPQVY